MTARANMQSLQSAAQLYCSTFNAAVRIDREGMRRGCRVEVEGMGTQQFPTLYAAVDTLVSAVAARLQGCGLCEVEAQHVDIARSAMHLQDVHTALHALWGVVARRAVEAPTACSVEAEAEAAEAAALFAACAEQAAEQAEQACDVEYAAVEAEAAALFAACAEAAALQPCEVEQAAEVAAMHEACALLQAADMLLCGPSDYSITAEADAEGGYCVWCDYGPHGCDMSDHGLTAAEATCYAVGFAASRIYHDGPDSCRVAAEAAWAAADAGQAARAVVLLRTAVRVLLAATEAEHDAEPVPAQVE